MSPNPDLSKLDDPTLAPALLRALHASDDAVLLLLGGRGTLHDANPTARRLLGPAATPGSELAAGLEPTDAGRLRTALASGGASPSGPLLLRRLRPTTDDGGPTDPSGALVSLARMDAETPDETLYLLFGRPAAAEFEREARALRAHRWALVGQLTGGVAHELNNRLSTVTTFSDLMLGDAKPGSQEAEDLEEIKEAGLETARLTRKLDLFAAGRADGSSADVADVVTGMEKLLRRFVGPQITLVTELEEGCPTVGTPAVRIEEVLVALAANARDAMPKGGTLTIRARPGHAGAVAGVTLEVVDTGEPAEGGAYTRALEPFFSSRPVEAAAGLGLFTVDTLVRAYGGTVELRAEPSSGTRALVFLPADRSADHTVQNRDPREDERTRERAAGGVARGLIGLVEPSDASRGALERGIRALGFSVSSAADVEGIAGLGAVDAMVVDVPDRPSAVTRVLRAVESAAGRVPVVLLRRRSHPALLAGARDDITELAKPTDFGTIHRSLVDLLTHGRSGTTTRDRTPGS